MPDPRALARALRGKVRGGLRLLRAASRVAAARAGAPAPSCKVCAARTLARLAYKRVFYHCTACDFVFATDNDDVPLATRGMGFEGSWSGPGGGGHREWWLTDRLTRDLGLERVLLYGTGNTPTFATLLGAGVDVVGCDISEDVVRAKRQEFGAGRFVTPDEVEPGSFDLVVAVEVFEHFAQPGPSLALLAGALTPRGVIAGTTSFYPGGPIVDGNTPGYMSIGDHVAYWNERSLGTAVQAFGLSLSAHEMLRPGSVLPDEKYGQLFPNKRVFFVFPPEHRGYFEALRASTPILPIDRP